MQRLANRSIHRCQTKSHQAHTTTHFAYGRRDDDVMAEKVTKSGRVVLPSGESIIPASTRADGSVRKAIKVKPGYKPPEDVEVYKNRSAESWKNRGSGGVPGAAAANEEQSIPPLKAAANAKRREREKAKKAEEAAAKAKAEDSKQQDAKTAEPVDPEAEKAKEARKLAKKLRQARELKDKKESGGALLPEQFEKVIKINELIRQLDKLGFDAEGEKKGEKSEDGATEQDKDQPEKAAG